jgi:hypothetical protein
MNNPFTIKKCITESRVREIVKEMLAAEGGAA